MGDLVKGQFLSKGVLILMFYRPFLSIVPEGLMKFLIEFITLIVFCFSLRRILINSNTRYLLVLLFFYLSALFVGWLNSWYKGIFSLGFLDLYDAFQLVLYSVMLLYIRGNRVDSVLLTRFFRNFVYLTSLFAILYLVSDSFREVFGQIYIQKSEFALENLSNRARFSGTFTNPNHLGLALCFIAAYEFFNKTKTSIIVIILIVLLVLLTGSRTSLLALLWLFLLRFPLKVFVIGVFSMGFISSMDILINKRLVDTIEGIGSGGLLAIDSLNTKYKLTKISLEKISEEGLYFGFGPSNHLDFYIGDNQWIFFLWKSGLIGLFCILIFFVGVSTNSKISLVSTSLLFLAFFTGGFFGATQVMFVYFLVSVFDGKGLAIK